MEGPGVLRFQSAFALESAGDKAALFVVGILPAAVLFGLAVFLFATAGVGALEWDDWLTLVLIGSLCISYSIIDLVPRTVAVDDRAIDLRGFWNSTRILFPSIKHVYLARKGGRLLIAVESPAGAVVTVGNGFDEDAKSLLLARLQQGVPSYGSRVTEVEPREFWRLVLVRRKRPTAEVRPRWTTYAAAALALVGLVAGLGAIGVVTAAKGYAAVAVLMALLAPAIALIVLSQVLRREGLLDGAFLLLGVAVMFWGIYPLVAPMLGLDPIASPSSLWLAPLIIAFGTVILLWSVSRTRHRREPEHPEAQ